MSHIMCVCGEPIEIGIIPNPQGFKLISELSDESILSKLTHELETVSNEADLDKDITKILSHLGTPGILQAYECKNCGRLAVFARSSDVIPVFWFQLEKMSSQTKFTLL